MRNIQNRDVDLGARQMVYRHTKNGKVQVVPLCSKMVSILREYMTIRKGEPEEYLFCNQYGEMLSENALRLAIAHYIAGWRRQAFTCFVIHLPVNIWLTVAGMRLCFKSCWGILPLP